MAARSPAVVGPIERPDANPPHPNPIRRFREELRLTREEFCAAIGAKVDSLRMWESSTRGRNDQPTKPKGEIAMAIIDLAKRNFYPLTIEDIFQPSATVTHIAAPQKKKKQRHKATRRNTTRRK